MSTWLMKSLIALPAVGLALPAHAQMYSTRPGWSDGWDWGWGWGFGHMAFGGLMMLLFWGGIILVIVLAVRWLGGGSSGAHTAQPPRKTPREILEERFAHGDIDRSEFEERRRLLSD